MAQVVFVHGVATRSSPEYAVESDNRTRLLKDVAFEGLNVRIESPVWGDLVPPKAWSGQCFPKFGAAGVSSFSLAAGMGAPAAAVADAGGARPLAAAAAIDPLSAVDSLFAQMVQQADAQGLPLSDAQVAEFRAAARKIMGAGFTADLSTAADDREFVDKVRAEMGGPVAFGGIGDWLKSAAGAVVDRTRNLAGDGLVILFRDQLNPRVAEFLGDIFAYLKAGPVRDRIRALVVGALSDAGDRVPAGEHLVVIGHSLGGVILYDLLSDPACGLRADFRVDLLLTVGSQPGLFEELKLFTVSDLAIHDPQKVPGPQRVRHWLNVFDPIDLFGFRTSPIFDQAQDFRFDSATGLIDAHTTYFKRPQFHARLREHLTALNIK